MLKIIQLSHRKEVHRKPLEKINRLLMTEQKSCPEKMQDLHNMPITALLVILYKTLQERSDINHLIGTSFVRKIISLPFILKIYTQMRIFSLL